MFNNRWLADYSKTDYDGTPRMTPCLLNGKEIEKINFFSQLQRKTTFKPEVFSTIAAIVFDTSDAANFMDIISKKAEADSWKIANPKLLLIDASANVKSTPVKSQPSKKPPVEGEKTSGICLPVEMDSGDEITTFGNDVDDEENSKMIGKIRTIDWAAFNFEVPTSTIKKGKDAPSKFQHYQTLVEKCRMRDIALWLKEKGDDLKDMNEPNLDLVGIRAKFESWNNFTYKTNSALKMLEKYQKEEEEKSNVTAAQHPTSTTKKAAKQSAEPVTPVTIAQMMNGLGSNQDAVMTQFEHSLNHLLHHASVIQTSLERQSKSLMSDNPPEALTVFSDVTIGITGLRHNITQFAQTFGLPTEKLIFTSTRETSVTENTVDSAQFGAKVDGKELAEIITKMTIEQGTNNFKSYDIRLLIDSMKWSSELKSKLDPVELVSRTLMFRCNTMSDLRNEYFNKEDKKKPSSTIGKLAEYLQQLSSNGWVISFDKLDTVSGVIFTPMSEKECDNNYFFLVTKDLDQYLSNWSHTVKVGKGVQMSGLTGK